MLDDILFVTKLLAFLMLIWIFWNIVGHDNDMDGY